MAAVKKAAPKPPVFDSEHEKAKAAFKAVDAERTIQAAGAIAILERRAAATKEIELSDGDMVPIRARLSRTRMAECYRLFQFIAEKKDTDDAAVVSASNQLVGQLLFVDGMEPAEITEWLEQNPDKFSDTDAAKILTEYGQLLVDEKNRKEAMVPFRAE